MCWKYAHGTSEGLYFSRSAELWWSTDVTVIRRMQGQAQVQQSHDQVRATTRTSEFQTVKETDEVPQGWFLNKADGVIGNVNFVS